MRRAAVRGLTVATAAVALAGALLPAGAAAAPAMAPADAFHLQRGRYEIHVGNLGQTVAITVETGALRSLDHIASTTYVAHGTATEGRLEADFGELGHISMRFRPSPHHSWEKRHRNCRGSGAFLVRHGTWQGHFRFRGEGGYLSLDLHRARGHVEVLAPGCRNAGKHRHGKRRHGHGRRDHRHRGSGKRRHDRHHGEIAPTQEGAFGKEVPVLQAGWRHGVAAAEFVGGASREGSDFFVSTQEARGRIAVFRAARAEGRRRAMVADGALTRAKLTPPQPFHGTGEFAAAPDGSRSWSGDIYVTFPGAPHYELSGGPFEPSLKLFPELLISLIGVFAHHERRPALPGLPGRLPCPQPAIAARPAAVELCGD